ncbi:MAG: hypothetical protein WCO64_07745 [Actinomycetes bacterium]
MIEIAIRDDLVEPFVERLPGPIVRINVASSQDVVDAVNLCRSDLHEAVEWAVSNLYSDDLAHSRVFIRNANGQEMVTMVDPCVTYGSQAIVRP